ncbi:helix-turn-helix domain-containing protein [Curtobacterium sp. VKM Ac-2884]|uniref:helix-turn-helix domain-containing protein n=1 Tax=Curtobacterium sp. VKM Ac-2884 TaxID=2783818 RepID=UPI00188A4B0B|nr:helix-turn-helix domain-containing protein [Curtobacterium sp. VKM Ac-2884]MBF4604711.1 helix-turn-helix domain-containing protein [Curtobacterium sp. VKM Ac-2884]
MTMTHTWLRYAAAASYLGTSERQLRRLVADKKIGHTKLGLHTLFSTDQLDAYIRAHTFTPGQPS